MIIDIISRYLVVSPAETGELTQACDAPIGQGRQPPSTVFRARRSVPRVVIPNADSVRMLPCDERRVNARCGRSGIALQRAA